MSNLKLTSPSSFLFFCSFSRFLASVTFPLYHSNFVLFLSSPSLSLLRHITHIDPIVEKYSWLDPTGSSKYFLFSLFFSVPKFFNSSNFYLLLVYFSYLISLLISLFSFPFSLLSSVSLSSPYKTFFGLLCVDSSFLSCGRRMNGVGVMMWKVMFCSLKLFGLFLSSLLAVLCSSLLSLPNFSYKLLSSLYLFLNHPLTP